MTYKQREERLIPIWSRTLHMEDELLYLFNPATWTATFRSRNVAYYKHFR